ncbi:uncharacterized protein LOC116430346 isoform X2 [Nomia melanderi]|uniref:uncharacterized protein LOC116430346 isoform X2 n=1 Tax=Nomia melanderi TaxID=2448451 RepID=UPI003FCED30D
MTGSRLRPAFFVGLFLALLAVALQGVQSEEELEVPPEDLCRPYIEKALKDLGTGSLEQTSAEVGTDADKESHEDAEKPASEEGGEPTADVSKEDLAAEGEPESVEAASAPESAEQAEDEAGKSAEADQSAEAAAEASAEADGDGSEQKSGEAGTEEDKDESPEKADEAADSGQEQSAEEADVKSGEEAEDAKSEEAQTEEEKSAEQQEEEEDGKTEEAQTEEEKSGEAAETDEGKSDEEGRAEDDQSNEEAEAQGESAEAKPDEEKSDEATTGEVKSEEATSAEEAASADEAEGASKEEAEEASKEEAEEGASKEEAEGASKEEAEGASAEAASGEESKADETAESQEQPASEEEAKDSKEGEGEGESADQTESGEAQAESAEAQTEEAKESEEEAKEESAEGEAAKSEEDAASEAAAKSEEEEEAKSAEEEGKSEAAESAEEAKSEEEGAEATKSRARREVGEEGDAESAEAEAEGSEEAAKSEEEPTPEEDLIKEIVVPENLRPRDHINQLLKLDEENEEKERAIDRNSDSVLKELKRVYDNAIQPLESLYKYRDLSNRHFGDPEIFSKPLVLFMGPWSGGKSSIINYLADIEYKQTSLRTGAEPSPAYFNIVMHGEEEEVLDGTQLAADWTFSGLQKFGQGLLDRLKGLRLNSKLLEKVNIVEIPGILEIRKQVQRLFPFNDACQWFIDRADIIFLVYDPSKLDVGPETEAILDQLKGREYQTRIILNKADQVKPEELMRVQGALIWNISPLMSSAEPPIMYSTSLWSIPYEAGAPTRLLYAQERAFLRDLRTAIDKRVEHKIASARRFAVRVRNHAKMVDCYLTTYYNHKTFFGNKKEISDKIIENPQDYHIYEGLSTLKNISRYDLPDPDVYRDFFRLNPLYDFPLLSSTCTYFRGCPINRLDVAIAYDLPELVGKYKKSVEQIMHEYETSPPS